MRKISNKNFMVKANSFQKKSIERYSLTSRQQLGPLSAQLRRR